MSWEFSKVSTELANYKEHWVRFWTDIKAVVDLPKDGAAWKTLSHSYVNLFVEFYRLFAYTIGHIAAITWPIGVYLTFN